MSPQDSKKPPRIKDPQLLKYLHHKWRMCALCGASNQGLSLHHVLKHPRDDVEGNLVMLCGDGVRGCHGAVEAHDHVTVTLLKGHILGSRPDVVTHLIWRLGSADAAQAWFL